MAVELTLIGVEVPPIFIRRGTLEVVQVDGVAVLGGEQRNLVVRPALVDQRIQAVFRDAERILRGAVDESYGQAGAAAGCEMIAGEGLEGFGDLAGVAEVVSTWMGTKVAIGPLVRSAVAPPQRW